MSELKQVITEMIQKKLSEAVPTPKTAASLHSELRALGPNHFQPDNGSETSVLYRSPDKNKNYDAVHKILSDHGYKRIVHNRHGGSSYSKMLNGGKNKAVAEVRHTTHSLLKVVDKGEESV